MSFKIKKQTKKDFRNATKHESKRKSKLELIEELPLIVKDWHREVAKILECTKGESKITLQTNEYAKVDREVWNIKNLSSIRAIQK